MKNITLAISILLGLVFSACSKDNNEETSEIMYGQKDSVSLNMKYTLEGLNTKAINETLIENVNLYIVNELGDLVSYGYYTNSTSIEAVIYNKMRYTVYAIANAGKQMKAKTGTEIENLIYSINSSSDLSSPTGAVLMSGKSALQTLSDKQILTIDMVRCLSKIVVRADYSQLNAGVDIQVKSLQLKNIPKIVNVFKDSKVSQSSDAFDGQVISNPTSSQLSSGISLYQFENKQGTLMPNNGDQKSKVWPDGSANSKTCSYVQLEASYSSPRKRGNITYRFYLGKDMTSNFDVIRNTQQNVTVYFKGDGAVDENTWRVDNTDIVDLVTSISLSPSSIKFTSIGDTKLITATVLPASAANKTLTWKSSNTSVAKVSASGVVTSVGDGSCTITATSTDGSNITSSINVVVDSNIYVTGVSVSPSTVSLFNGESYSLTANITPSNATNKSVTWSSSNNNVATVDANGKVTAKAQGSCTIYATSNENSAFKGSCAVTVTNKQFTITPTSKSLYVGESFTITYSATPDATATFSSNNTSVATVDANGKVTAKAKGTATISAVANGITRTCNVTVSNAVIEFDGDSRSMYINDVVILTFAAVVPSNSIITSAVSNRNLEIMSCSAAGVMVKAKAVGTCTVTASTGGASDTYTVTITERPVENYEIEFNGSSRVMYDGEQATLTFSKLTPSNANVTATASNANVEILSSSLAGVSIRAKSPGSCTITATAGNASDTYTINVQKLTITAHESSFVGYHHFNHTIGYTITPAHAASLGVTLTPDATANSHVLFTNANTVQFKSVPSGSPTMNMKVAVKGRDDVYTNVRFTIEEASITDKIKVNVNRGYNQVTQDLGLRIAPHANMNYSITPDVNNSLQNAVGNNIAINLGASTATFANPCGANGLYHLKVSATGDDGQPISLNCDIEVYETIYLVGVSKTQNKENLSNQDGIYYVRYSNEILAKWMAHPNSMFYSNGIVNDITIPFIYNGTQYDEEHTGEYVDNDFSFEKGQTYEMALTGETITFNGRNVPLYYHEYFYLKPADSNPWQVNARNGRYFYVYSRDFVSGFSNQASPEWKKIFDFVY